MHADTLNGQDVRQRILASAIELFSRHGYAATSIREIALLAHTTKPMIYYYFGSKEELYTSIVRAEFDNLAATLERAVQGAGTVEEALKRFITSYFRFFLYRGQPVRLIYKEMLGLGEQLVNGMSHGYFTRVKDALANVFRHAQQEAALPPAFDPEASALAVMGILNVFVARRLLGHKKFEIRTAVDQILNVYLAGLRHAAPPHKRAAHAATGRPASLEASPAAGG